MKQRGWTAVFFAAALSSQAHAETLTLDQAIERALGHDPRIEERRHLVEAADALMKEARGHRDWIFDLNTFLGFSPRADDGFFNNNSNACASGSNCALRTDKYHMEGFSLWSRTEFSIIKPLYTFGKIERYTDAASANVEVVRGNVRLQRSDIILDVKRAYYGYLAAHETHLLLADVRQRVDKAADMVKGWLENGENNAKQSDLYALQAGSALVGRYIAQAEGLERVAMEGLRVLTGIEPGADLQLAEDRLNPLPLPETELPQLQNEALNRRPEMSQVEAGLRARRALVEARKSESGPDIYAGVAGVLSYSPMRDRLNNPFISDPFNDVGVTPVIGLKWSWIGDVQSAKVHGAEAELDALIAKASLARQGIPYEVAEQYYQTRAYYGAVQEMEQASRASRRWMISSYADFEAGVEQTEKVVNAFQAYVLAHSDYLKTVFEYNMYVAQLSKSVGTDQQ